MSSDNTDHETLRSENLGPIPVTYGEIWDGIKSGLRRAWPSIWGNYVRLPIGLILMLLPLYGINNIMKSVAHISVPASVVCMLLLFFGLLGIERVFGTRKASIVLGYVDIPCGWCLRWINIFFTPSFTLLPLASKVTVAEAFEIAGVFAVGYVVMLLGSIYFVWGLQRVLHTTRKTNESIDSQDSRSITESSVNDDPPQNYENTEQVELRRFDTIRSELSSTYTQRPQPVYIQGSSLHFPAPSTIDESLPVSPNTINEIPTRTAGDAPSDRGPSAQSVQTPPANSDILISQEISAFVMIFWDWFVYITILLLGQIVYFTTKYEMPLHLSIVVLCFRGALLLPANYRKVLHPIIVAGGMSILLIYIFSLINGTNVMQSFRNYKTGRNYLTLFDSDQKGIDPGAGDVLSTLLDCSIVALSLPMYRYRVELRRFFVVLTIPSVFFGAASFFVYPPLSKACGIESSRALAFMARSVTLALALPIVEAVQGSTSLASVVAILSGISGVLFGFPMMRILRVRDDDYVTRGISLGIVSSAVGAAHLLNIDPRASALSSLTFFLYGIVMVILSVIPPVVNTVRAWVDLGPI